MRPHLLRLICIILFVAMGLGVAFAISSAQQIRARSVAVASVDGVEISRAAFDEYTAVFTDPEGHLTMPRDQVLVSLINQLLVHREARRLRVSVSDTEVDQAVAGVLSLAPSDVRMRRSGGIEGLRRRVYSFFEFRELRAIVTGSEAPVGVRASNMLVDPQSTNSAADSRWNNWLAGARRCAAIDVFDESLGVAPSKPGPDCLSQK